MFRHKINIKLAILISLKVGFSKLKHYIKAIVFTRNIIIIRSIYSPMRFPYKSIQTACYYKENPPVPIWRQKPYKCIGKMPYLRLTLRLALRLTLRLALRQGKTYILLSFRRGCLCRGLSTYTLPTYLQGVML